jgi:hypothetical protein
VGRQAKIVPADRARYRGGVRDASRAWAGAAGVFLAACAFHASYAFHGLAEYDEGLLLDGAARVLRGETWGRDFQAPYGPGRYYALAGWWQLFGPSVGSWRGLAVVLQALADALVFRLVVRRAPWSAALSAAVLLAVAHGSLFKSFLLLSIVLVLCAGWLADARRGRCLAAGALLGLACVFRYDIGAFGLVALVLGGVLAGGGPRGAVSGAASRAAWLAAGCAAPVLLTGALLAAAGFSPSTWCEQTRVFLGAQLKIRPEHPALWEAGAAGPLEHWLLWTAITGSALTCVAHLLGVVARRRRGAPLDGDGFRAAAALFGLALFHQLSVMVTLNRLFQIVAPTFVLLADLLCRRGRGAPVRVPARAPARAGQAALLGVTLLVIAWVHLTTQGMHPGSYTARNADFVPLEVRRAGILVAPATARNLGALVETIRAEVPEGEPIHVGLRPQALAFLADRPLALPYAEVCYFMTNAAAQQDAIAQLERARPRLYIEDPRPVIWFTMEADAPLLARYLAEHYAVQRSIGPYTVWQRLP